MANVRKADRNPKGGLGEMHENQHKTEGGGGLGKVNETQHEYKGGHGESKSTATQNRKSPANKGRVVV